MAYVILALLLPAPAAAALSVYRPGIALTDLGQGLQLLPLTESRLHEFGSAATVFEVGEDGEFSGYTIGVAELLGQLARHGDAAFVGAEFFGGLGTQWAVVHLVNQRIPQIFQGADAINQALRQLGVTAAAQADEFDTVGLGRFRSTEEWLPGNA